MVMEVLLYVYDLSHGLARQMSMQFLGIQIDAVYHTSIILQGTEYFYGQGIQMCPAGRSHHGRPMEIVNLGHTDLPLDVIEEYLGALRETYTAESYDLFMHNCNNFSHDLSQFLVGKGIPQHITNLPRQVLNTPFGRMLQPQLDASMRSVTQASVPAEIAPNTHTIPKEAPKATKLPSHPHDSLDLDLLNKDASVYLTSNAHSDFETLDLRLSALPHASLSEAVNFVRRRADAPGADVPLPDLSRIRDSLHMVSQSQSEELLGALLELLLLLLLDSRVSVFLVDDKMARQKIVDLLRDVVSKQASTQAVQSAALGMSTNLFASKQSRRAVHQDPALNGALIDLITKNLLAEDAPELRVSASALALNLSTTHYNWIKKAYENSVDVQSKAKEYLPEDRQVEFAAALIEVVSAGDVSPECSKHAILALGRLAYRAPVDGEMMELCRSLEAGRLVQQQRDVLEMDGALVDEVASLF